MKAILFRVEWDNGEVWTAEGDVADTVMRWYQAAECLHSLHGARYPGPPVTITKSPTSYGNRMMTDIREEATKWLEQQNYCIGYPVCDGEREGIEHSQACPLHGIKDSAGQQYMITYIDAFVAGWKVCFSGRTDLVCGPVGKDGRRKTTRVSIYLDESEARALGYRLVDVLRTDGRYPAGAMFRLTLEEVEEWAWIK